MNSLFFILLLVGFFSSYVAKKKGKNPYVWFLVGFFFGIIGFLILYLFSKKKPAINNEEIKQKQKNTSKELLSFLQDSQKFWYFLNENDEHSEPLSVFALRDKLQQKDISLSTYVWNEDMSDWKKIKDIPLLSSFISKES
jgi:hypothetical protein